MKKIQLIILAIVFSTFSHGDVYLSGFASVVGGKTISDKGDRFLADYPLVGVYNDELNFQPESSVGLQARADMGEGLSFTMQWIARGLDSFNSEVNYAYLSYEITPDITLQAGRKRLPLQYYSEFYDVGFAYPWIRPPVDLYTWQILNYNGVNLIHKSQLAGGVLNTSFYLGREESKNNKLLTTFFFNEPTDEIWKDIIGISFDYSFSEIQALVSYTNFKRDRFYTSPTTTNTNSLDLNTDFFAVSVNYDNGDYFALTEWNLFEQSTFATTNWLMSAGYRYNQFTPYFSLSNFKQNEKIAGEDLEEHTTQSLGLRWNFHDQAAFKVQFDDIKDEGTLPLLGDSQSLTFGVDLIF